ncbi:glycosyltransferase family 2 protein [Brenneria goodwinii]|uniref:Alpha-L-Rha alpha-1,3-L-rhamnosyltransferase n=1 Tax=Brenneria goodwinii TaxID=1109412 RepID=A0A0G4JNZ3_9GAMM|nr:glycosyltransferase family 2 protein [Brenneria goodwinii]CPR13637.1 Alpha-L-Rha alpha-1,3-L-rhamnosyltransferase [Brenneria goodwinii]
MKTSNTPEISIIIATFNGEKFVSEQIESIVKNDNFSELVKEIIISDDGSTDSTIDIIKKYQRIYNIISFIENSSGEHGVVNNFSRGITVSSGNYIMLCDQDDVWLSSKIKISYRKIKELESQNGNKPTIVFSDLIIVDEKLNVKYKSFFDFNKISINESTKLNSLLLNNVAPGCTCILNKSLIKASFPIPNNVIMHDWWFMLVAASIGEVFAIKEPLILYRQHESNVIGAKKINIFNKILNIKENSKYYSFIKKQKIEQAKNIISYNFGREYKINIEIRELIYSFEKNIFYPVSRERTLSRKILSILAVFF